MAGLSPFTTSTPLSGAPYFSRVADMNLVDSPTAKNYPMLAFKPGYALQASELNEIQDNFYVQKTLSDNLIENWWKTGNNLELTGTELENLYGPSWYGAVPLRPDYFSVNILTNVYSQLFANTNRMWFHVTDPTSKFKFWISVDATSANAITLFNTGNYVSYIGFNLTSEIVGCSGDPVDEGYSFNDNSSGNYIENTCGASRFKLTAGSFTAVSTLTDNFLPIMKVRRNYDQASSGIFLMQYMNNYLIQRI